MRNKERRERVREKNKEKEYSGGGEEQGSMRFCFFYLSVVTLSKGFIIWVYYFVLIRYVA